MGFDVKNTTKIGLLDWFCPHTCRGCGALGSIFCECCKKYMSEQRRNVCPICKRMLEKSEQKCQDCEMPFRRFYVGGYREGALAKLIQEYKYQSVRAVVGVLTGLLFEAVPEDLGVKRENTVVVPLPTIGRHVRQRGLDHTKNMAKKLAKVRGWRFERILERAADTVQVGTSAAERSEQAKRAYRVFGKVDPDKTYVLLDDVWTTGASMLSAAEVMMRAGAKDLVGVVVATGKPKNENKVKEEEK